MEKTLSNIQTCFKIGKILATIVLIASGVGAIMCIVGIALLALGFDSLPVGDGLTLFNIIETNVEGFDKAYAYAEVAGGFVECIGGVVLGFLFKNYFDNELSAGTPFNFGIAKQTFKLGWLSLVVEVAFATVGEVVANLISAMMGTKVPDTMDLDINIEINVTLCLALMFLSLIFKHGAELVEKTKTE